jgi:hypothetical protein
MLNISRVYVYIISIIVHAFGRINVTGGMDCRDGPTIPVVGGPIRAGFQVESVGNEENVLIVRISAVFLSMDVLTSPNGGVGVSRS